MFRFRILLCYQDNMVPMANTHLFFTVFICDKPSPGNFFQLVSSPASITYVCSIQQKITKQIASPIKSFRVLPADIVVMWEQVNKARSLVRSNPRLNLIQFRLVLQ